MKYTNAGNAPSPRLLSKIAAVALAALLLAFSLPLPVAAQEGGQPLHIGIIGAGAMGGPLGVLWAQAGHRVLFSSRNPDQLMDLVREASPRASAGYPEAAADFADVVVLAVPPSAIPQLGEDLGALLQDKIVIDLTNPRADRDGAITEEWLEIGTGVAMAQYLPGARVVKALNTLGAFMLEQAHRPGEQIGVPVAGDDDEAVAIVSALVRDAGFDPVLVGPLESARTFDRGSPVWVTGMTADEIRDALDLPSPP